MRKYTPYFQEFTLSKINTKMDTKNVFLTLRPRIKMFSKISGHVPICTLLIPNLMKNFMKKKWVFFGIFKDGWTMEGPAYERKWEIILSTSRGIPGV